jgi:hypothetical protein
VRLVQRRQRTQRLQSVQHRGIDEGRLGESGTPWRTR